MSNDFDKTKVFNPDVTDKLNENNIRSKHKKKPTRKKRFRLLYFIPIVIMVTGSVFVYYLWKVAQNDGPVYGDRCAGVTDINDSAIKETNNVFLAEPSIKDLSIEVICRQVKVNITFVSGTTIDEAEAMAAEVLRYFDVTVGYNKANVDDKYSILFGVIDGVQQYHVDFVILSEDGGVGGFPSFASKHPNNQFIVFTRNETKDPELVDRLKTNQSQGEVDSDVAVENEEEVDS